MANINFAARECIISPCGNSNVNVYAQCDYDEVLADIPIKSIVEILGDELLDEIGIDKCTDYFDIA